jgi:hypothetical protein
VTPGREALDWATRHLGQHEEPPGSNTGRFVRECQAATWLGGTRWPWCVAFYLRAWEATGRPLPWRGAGAWAFLAWAQTAGWAVPLEHAVPGDAIIWRFGAGHCSMLELPYRQTRPNVQTIDGNVSDAVTRRTRHVSEVRGAIHVHATAKPPRPAPPTFEVATSASGHRKLLLVGGRRKVARNLARLFNRYGGLTVSRRKKGAAS